MQTAIMPIKLNQESGVMNKLAFGVSDPHTYSRHIYHDCNEIIKINISSADIRLKGHSRQSTGSTELISTVRRTISTGAYSRKPTRSSRSLMLNTQSSTSTSSYFARSSLSYVSVVI